MADKYVEHITNEKGEVLANVYETEAFKEVYDHNRVNERRLNLPRKQLQVFNDFKADTHLFQKLYYHPGLLREDEVKLRQIFNDQNSGHDTLHSAASIAWFAAYWPMMYRFSRSVTPAGCGAFTLVYAGLWWKGVSPFLLQRL